MGHEPIGADPGSALVVGLLVEAALDHPPTDGTLHPAQAQQSKEPVAELGHEVALVGEPGQRNHEEVAEIHAHLTVQELNSVDRLKPLQVNIPVHSLKLHTLLILLELHIPLLLSFGILFRVGFPISHAQPRMCQASVSAEHDHAQHTRCRQEQPAAYNLLLARLHKVGGIVEGGLGEQAHRGGVAAKGSSDYHGWVLLQMILFVKCRRDWIAIIIFNRRQRPLDLQWMHGRARVIIKCQVNPQSIMSSIALLVTLAALLHPALAQECAFPSQRCSCLTTTPLCLCSALMPDSTFNVSTGYRSRLVALAGLGCIPCPMGCMACTAYNVCTVCRDQYVLVNNTCLNCPTNCRRCRSNLLCLQCKSTYYLDSQLECQTCPLEGTLQCTIDTLKSCLPAYWLDNNGANCVSCDPNCRQCSSTTKCATCADGYYLSSFGCVSCRDICAICTSGSACVRCLGLAKYYDVGTGACLTCGLGCLECLNASMCTLCGGGSSAYLLSNGSCVVVPVGNAITNCLQHQYINSTLRCTRCMDDHFQQIGSNTCIFGCSILCQQCQGAHFGLCTRCIDTATLYNRNCLPNNNIIDGTAYQLYYTATHNNASSVLYGQYESITRLANSCLRQSVLLSSGRIGIRLDNLQVYKLVLVWKLYLLGTIDYQVTFVNANSVIRTEYNCTRIMSEGNCTDVCVSKANLTIDASILQANNMTIEVQQGRLGFAELLVVGYRCGGVQGASCLECSQVGQCTRCVNPEYYLLAEKCVQECPATYYIYTQTRKCYRMCPPGTYSSEEDNQRKLCQKCPAACLTCSSNSTCFSCDQGFFLLQTSQSCIATCPGTFFANSFLRRCEKCAFPCFQCTSNRRCISCMYGFLQDSTQTCTIVCPVGYYGSLDTRQCQACASPCQSCQLTNSTCITCLAGFIDFYGLCLVDCPDGYYQLAANTSSPSCVACPTQCQACSNSTQCTRCAGAGYLLQGTCYASCPITYYNNKITHKCSQCQSRCLSCNNLTHCIICRPQYRRHAYLPICVQQCQQLQYAQTLSYTLVELTASNSSLYYLCKQCMLPCHACISATSCLSCRQSFLLAGACVDTCPDGLYPDTTNLTCTPCPQQCATCLSTSQCTKCGPSYVLYSGACLSTCPAYYYRQSLSQTCLACALDCWICTNNTFCLNCTAGLVSNQQGLCTGDCPNGFYPDYTLTRTCIPCGGNCSICSYNDTLQQPTCLLCLSGYYLSPDSLCVQTCSAGYYGAYGLCYQCSPPCATCQSAVECVSCLGGYGYWLKGQCVAECPLGFEGVNWTCVECGRGCRRCGGGCWECQQGYYLDKVAGNCVTALQCEEMSNQVSGYFAFESMGVCSPCSEACMRCTGSSQNCTQCQPGYGLYSYQCLTVCPEGLFLSGSTCLSCDTGTNLSPNKTQCSRCLNNSVCLQCHSNFYLLATTTTSSQCLASCPQHYYPSDSACRPCPYPCLTCTSPLNCSDCHLGFLLHEYTCLMGCPSGYFTSSVSCLMCPAQCLQCTNSTQCTICQQGYSLFEGACLQLCPLGMYGMYGACQGCGRGCRRCENPDSCQECSSGFMYEGVCVEECPYGLIQIKQTASHTCVGCLPQCLSCRVRPGLCTSCASPRFLHLQQCLMSCPAGTYPQQQLRRCVTCSKPCQTCTASDSCQTCIYGYILYIQQSRSQCVQGPRCPNSYYLDMQNNVCRISCNAGQYEQSIARACWQACPQGFVADADKMRCLHECPDPDMWVDGGRVCQQGRSALDEQWVRENLPYYGCSWAGFRGLLQLVCVFTVGISNIGEMAVGNIEIQGFRVLEMQKSADGLGFRLFVEPTGQSKITQKWLKISLRPRYMLYHQPAPTRRLLASTQPLPLQVSDHELFVSGFNFYTPQQRQTGLYLGQLSNSISISALVIWLCSLLKNKKSWATVYVVGLQWLYLASILGDNNFAPNLVHFLEGFKYALLALRSRYGQGFTVDYGRRVWRVSMMVRQELVTPVDLMDCRVLLVPIAMMLGALLGLFGVLNLLQLVIYRLYREQIDQVREDKTQVKSVAPSKKMKASGVSTRTLRPHGVDLYKKVSILISRFHYNYIQHILLIVSVPISLLTFTQALAPEPLGLACSLLLSLLLFLSWGIACKQLFTNSHSLYNQSNYKYYLLVSIQSYILGLVSVLGTMGLTLGVLCIAFLFNLYIYFAVWRQSEWKLRLLSIVELLKIGIVGMLMAAALLADAWTSSQLFSYGWVPVLGIVGYAIVLAVVAARDFLEDEALAYRDLLVQERKTKILMKRMQTQGLLEINSDNNQKYQQSEKQGSGVLEGEQAVSISLSEQYQEEESFFEDEDEATYTSGEGNSQASSNLVPHSRVPQVLIKHMKQH